MSFEKRNWAKKIRGIRFKDRLPFQWKIHCYRCKNLFERKNPQHKYCGSVIKKIGCSYQNMRERHAFRYKNGGREYARKWQRENKLKVREYAARMGLKHPNYHRDYLRDYRHRQKD